MKCHVNYNNGLVTFHLNRHVTGYVKSDGELDFVDRVCQ